MMRFARKKTDVIEPPRKRLFHKRSATEKRIAWAWFLIVAAFLEFTFLWSQAMAGAFDPVPAATTRAEAKGRTPFCRTMTWQEPAVADEIPSRSIERTTKVPCAPCRVPDRPYPAEGMI